MLEAGSLVSQEIAGVRERNEGDSDYGSTAEGKKTIELRLTEIKAMKQVD